MEEKTQPSRPDWDTYFIDMLDAVAKRATCDRGKTSAIFTRDNRVLMTGYAGAPPGEPQCDEVGHEYNKVIDPNGNESTHCVRTKHAERNCIDFAAREGIPLKDSTVYVTLTPCWQCATSLLIVGVKRVVAKHLYQKGQRSIDFFSKHGIEYLTFDTSELKYGDSKPVTQPVVDNQVTIQTPEEAGIEGLCDCDCQCGKHKDNKLDDLR